MNQMRPQPGPSREYHFPKFEIRSLDNGINVVIAPADTPFGARFYAVRDPENLLWWISTYRPAKPGIAAAHTSPAQAR